MEDLKFNLPSGTCVHTRDAVLVGVVASGNCEVLMERATDRSAGVVIVHTSVHGYADTWKRVLGDFATRHHIGGLSIEINDVGATPAVVSLRLDQVMETWQEDSHA